MSADQLHEISEIVTPICFFAFLAWLVYLEWKD